jgi:hypothetical protein
MVVSRISWIFVRDRKNGKTVSAFVPQMAPSSPIPDFSATEPEAAQGCRDTENSGSRFRPLLAILCIDCCSGHAMPASGEYAFRLLSCLTGYYD